MASKKKEQHLAPAIEAVEAVEAVEVAEIDAKDIIPDEEAKKLKDDEVQEVKAEKVIIKSDKPEEKNRKIEPKAKIGEIVYVSRDADSDLNGFKLFPQYKKYTYTVEDYNQSTDVYSLRRANLLLRLKGEHILRPEEKAHDKLNRIQF